MMEANYTLGMLPDYIENKPDVLLVVTAVHATGAGSKQFTGWMDKTDIFKLMCQTINGLTR